MIDSSWEEVFSRWASSPSQTELDKAENALRAVRQAIASSPILQPKRLKVFAQGSYRNRVNVRSDSDVDIGVVCHDVFLDSYPHGAQRSDFGNEAASYSFLDYKNDLGAALSSHFGSNAVARGNKAFQVNENSYRINADVVPLFEYREYWEIGSARYRAGVALITGQGHRIENFPERLFDHWPDIPLHYENGIAKNQSTGRSFKGVVRILKCLLNAMKSDYIIEAHEVPGYLCECLVYMCPNYCFSQNSWRERLFEVLVHVYRHTSQEGLCSNWTEVDEIKFLFHDSQKWSRIQAHRFVGSVANYVGIRL